MGGANDRGLSVMATQTERAIDARFYEEVIAIFRIVWCVTGSAHQFTAGAEKYRIAVTPLLWDVCSPSREAVNRVGGAIEGWIC